MFPWSKKISKSVTFSQELADQSLLAVVETELVKQPHKSFSDLCKEALWQSLCVAESVRPTPRTAQIEQQVAELQRQVADFEQRFFARESSRLEAIERQLNQLTQQLAQLAIIVNQQPNPKPPPQLESAQSESEPEAVTPSTPQEVDPLLSRLSQFLDDF
jgi:uncharacterized membrane protein YccC